MSVEDRNGMTAMKDIVNVNVRKRGRISIESEDVL